MPSAGHPAEPLSTDDAVFSGSTVSAGTVRCHTSDPLFGAAGVVRGFRIVFPRLAVWIKPARARRYVSSPTIVEYYNDGDEYSREPLDPRGDSTEWFAVSEPVVREIVSRFDVAASEMPRPFRYPYGPTDTRAYASQRLLFQRLAADQLVDPLEIEETVLTLLDASLSQVYGLAAPADRPITRNERDIAERASAVVSQMVHQQATLANISREAAVSVFHLSRIFRRVTGCTLAKHHLHLRLLASLEPLLESQATVGEIATQYGFASHSHFGCVFLRVFGVSPSAFRVLPAHTRRETLARGARATAHPTAWRLS